VYSKDLKMKSQLNFSLNDADFKPLLFKLVLVYISGC
jgi:hypothetical protein